MFEKQINRSLRRHVIAGMATVVFLSIGVGGWASTTDIAGAVVAAGQLVVETSVKKVQHPTGGVVGDLYVREGDHVQAGDVVVRLDETQTRAELDIVLKNLDENAARRARMEAELSGVDQVTFAESLLSRSSDPAVAHLIRTETELFFVRQAARAGQKSMLREQITQLKQQNNGLVEQINGKDKELGWIKKELVGVNDLWAKNLIQFSRLTQLEREAAKIEGERGALIASQAQTNAKITEAELKILQVDEDMRQDVGRDMADIRGKTSELAEKRISAEDRLKRIDIRAPQNGTVHQLSVHTVGGVIAPPSVAAEPIMLIVPETDNLIVEARVQPQDIDQLHVGQLATLRFSAFNQRTTPELNGALSMVSADVTLDQKTGSSYYLIRIKVSEDEVSRLGTVKLVPGMPVEAFVKTGERTVMSYLTKPFKDQVMRAFREK
jgi:HlyD family secretion protein